MDNKIFKVKDVELKYDKKELCKDITNTITAIDENGEEVKYKGTFYDLDLDWGVVVGSVSLKKTKNAFKVQRKFFKKNVSESEKVIFYLKTGDLPLREFTKGEHINNGDIRNYKRGMMNGFEREKFVLSQDIMDAIYKPMEEELLKRFEPFIYSNN